jgi:Putative neutral zinc metallopeptidase
MEEEDSPWSSSWESAKLDRFTRSEAPPGHGALHPSAWLPWIGVLSVTVALFAAVTAATAGGLEPNSTTLDPELAGFLDADLDLVPVVPEPDRGEPTLRATIDAATASLDAFWTASAPVAALDEWRPIAAYVPYVASTGRIPFCGGGPRTVEYFVDQAFYCPQGDFVAWDAESLFPDVYERFEPFSVGVVLAHEMGHAVQARLHVTAGQRVLELQADCFAGAWAERVGDDPVLGPARESFLLELEAFFDHIGDPLGVTLSDDIAHGSGPIRARAFRDGMRRGLPACLDYERRLPLELQQELGIR